MSAQKLRVAASQEAGVGVLAAGLVLLLAIGLIAIVGVVVPVIVWGADSASAREMVEFAPWLLRPAALALLLVAVGASIFAWTRPRWRQFTVEARAWAKSNYGVDLDNSDIRDLFALGREIEASANDGRVSVRWNGDRDDAKLRLAVEVSA